MTGSTLRAARARLRRRVMAGERGVVCPCCDQDAALYTRRINGTMARQLRTLVEHGGWMHARAIELGVTSADRDFAKLRFWGLVETDGAFNWRATPLAHRFVANQTTVPAAVYLYNNEVQGRSREHVSFDQCLPRTFDLGEVLGERRAAE